MNDLELRDATKEVCILCALLLLYLKVLYTCCLLTAQTGPQTVAQP
jgi:hypothetical protein